MMDAIPWSDLPIYAVIGWLIVTVAYRVGREGGRAEGYMEGVDAGREAARQQYAARERLRPPPDVRRATTQIDN